MSVVNRNMSQLFLEREGAYVVEMRTSESEK